MRNFRTIREPTARLARWYLLFSYVSGALMLLVGIWIVGWEIMALERTALVDAQEQLELRARALELKVRCHSGHLERMQKGMEALLNQTPPQLPPRWDLLQDGEDGEDGKDGRFIFLRESDRGPSGGFFIRGTLDKLRVDPGLQKRVSDSTYLLALFGIEYQVQPTLVTTWYRRFGDLVVVFPRISPQDFRAAFDDVSVEEQLSLDTLAMPFWERLRPEVNPRGLPFWTEPYTDILGKGIAVTYAAPVRERGEVVGMVGTDVVLSHLHGLLLPPGHPGGRYILTGEEGMVLMAPDAMDASQVDGTLQDLLPAKGQDRRHELRTSVMGTPWTLVWSINKWEMLFSLLPETLVEFLLLGLFALLVLFGNLVVRRRYVLPAIALVKHLEAEAEGRRSEPGRVPQDWVRWFESVTNTFKLRQIAENLPVVVGRLRWDGVGPPREMFLGDRLHDLLRIPRDETIDDERLLAALHKDDRELLMDGLLEARSISGCVKRDVRVRKTEDQGRLWLRIFITSRDDAPSVYDCMAMDVTGEIEAEELRRRFETRMQQAQKAESLGILAGGVAHDFNNILMGMIGSAELAEMELAEDSPQRSHLREIIKGGRRASELAHQMLAYAGRGRLTLEHLSFNTLIQDLLGLLEASIPKKVELRTLLSPDLPIIEGDPTQLRQVIMNLVINAAEAIGERAGVITVTTMTREFHTRDPMEFQLSDELPTGVYACLHVNDTGCGMNAETRRKVFDPFFSTKFLGRGLGLASVLGIIRGHAGAIGVTSEPGQGTSFKVLLPVPAGPSGPNASCPTPIPVGLRSGRGTAMLVDDEPSVRTVVGKMLHRLGFETTKAVDGVEALDKISSAKELPMVVLLDYSMPRMDGPQTLTAIRAAWPKLPVLLFSGYDASELKRAGVAAADGYLQKPIRFNDLAATLDQILDRDDEPESTERP